MNELTDGELLQCTEEDLQFYKNCIDGLPDIGGLNGDGLGINGVPIPYGSGPHIIKYFKSTIEIVKPKKILEIGFNIGYGSSLWLNLTNANVVSCDISDKHETTEGAKYLMSKYNERFKFHWRGALEYIYSNPETLGYFDLCFIDGAHDEESIIKDIELSKRLNIPYLLFDDWYPRFGETQKAVIKFPELELVKDMNNLRLYKINYQ